MTRYYGQHNPPVDQVLEQLFPTDFIGYATDVGAGDGITDSNTYLFEQKGWPVLCIEPSPPYWEQCKQRRKIFSNCACGAISVHGPVPFHIFRLREGYGGRSYGAISSLRPDMRLLEHFNKLGDVREEWTFPVKVRSLDDLLQNASFPGLDLLSIDTEGTEVDILVGMKFQKYAPRVIVVENNWDEPDARTLLQSHGYKMVRRVEVNDFFVKE